MGDLTSAPIPSIRPDDHLRGQAGDPELTIMYADFSCPRCAVAAIALRNAGSSVVFRHFALRTRHPRAVPLAHAAEAAAIQGAFWPFHDALFSDQGRIDDRTCGTAAPSWASTSTASRPTVAPTRSLSAWRVTCARGCGPG